MADNSERRVEIKDLAVVVPLIASSVAMSYEVGRFLIFGGFYYFSISEHLLFALSSLPLALFGTIFLALIFVPISYFANRTHEWKFGPRIRTYIALLTIALLILFVVFMESNFVPELLREFRATLTLLLVIGGAILANGFHYRQGLTSPVVILFVLGMSITFAVTVAMDISNANISRVRTGRFLSEIVTKSATQKAFVVMGGERGLLLYHPDSKRVSFQRADEIQKIEWQLWGRPE
ncbi:hypothetical protein [Bradyrhizobium sp. 170]|uniref:hypothetical protein n=1 Tax=Bradyrhizobium sp. 170 TaxID=2782641 RepID=UPI001FFF38C5|nr:hypothetical protein [Bradyrhizobium sp. 170]UPK05338.1 hypothetical protein IVB05_06425 [Bradyrhizobium sp. 170]